MYSRCNVSSDGSDGARHEETLKQPPQASHARQPPARRELDAPQENVLADGRWIR